MPALEELFKRDLRCGSGWRWSSSQRRCVRYGNWHGWGRWVLAAVVVGIFFVFLLACLCLSRRRRRRGVKPIYGTGWMAPAGKFGNNTNQNNHQMYNYGQQQQNGYNSYGGQHNPPPAYGHQQQPQYTGTTFNQNDGYYSAGGHNTGMQPPQGTYQRDADVYSPPPGPPPNK